MIKIDGGPFAREGIGTNSVSPGTVGFVRFCQILEFLLWVIPKVD